MRAAAKRRRAARAASGRPGGAVEENPESPNLRSVDAFLSANDPEYQSPQPRSPDIDTTEALGLEKSSRVDAGGRALVRMAASRGEYHRQPNAPRHPNEPANSPAPAVPLRPRMEQPAASASSRRPPPPPQQQYQEQRQQQGGPRDIDPYDSGVYNFERLNYDHVGAVSTHGPNYFFKI